MTPVCDCLIANPFKIAKEGRQFSWNTLMSNGFTVPFIRQKQAFSYTKRSVK
jgi:hypothetical protein